MSTPPVQLARPLGPDRHVLSNLRLVLSCCASVDRPRRAPRAARGRAGCCAARRGDADRAADRRDRRSQPAPRGPRRRRGRPARDALQRDARSARALPAALDESVRAQRQLVADASHELRTPVTSLRTNVEVLLAGGELDDEDRRAAADRRRRAVRGAERAGLRSDRAGPRRPPAPTRPRMSGLTARRGVRRPRAAQRPGCHVRRASRAR